MLKIRDAELADLGRITEIYNWAVVNTTATFDMNLQTVEDRKEWFSHYGKTYPLIVADLDGKVTGYCSLSKFREKEAYAKSVEISVYIDPSYHRLGLGTLLIKEILSMAQDLGYHVIIAGITAGNEVSVKIHENLGFKFCGQFNEVGYKFDNWQDVLFYQLLI